MLTFVNRCVNPLVRAILRSPLHRLLSGRLALLTYTRANGAASTIPVGYVMEGDSVHVAVGAAEHKRWWRAVRRYPDVTVLVRGSSRQGIATVSASHGVTVDVTLSPAAR